MASNFFEKLAQEQAKKSQEYAKQRQKQAKEDDRTWNVLTGNLSSNGTYNMQAAQNKYLAQVGASRQPNIASLLPAPQTQIPMAGSGGRGVGPRPEQKQTSGGGVLGAIKGFFQELRPSKVLQGAREYQNVANQSSVDGQIDPIEAAAFGAARPALSLGETAVRALDGGKDPRVAEDLDRLKLMEQTARQTHPVAYGAGSVVGTLPIMSGIGGALGSVSAIEGLSPLAKGAALGGGARAALEAISGAGDVAGGRVSAGEYARNVASAGAGGAAGGAAAAGLSVIGNAVLNKLVSMPYLNMAAAPNLPGAVNKTITALERFGLNNNGLARAIVAGLSGVNFAAADTAASRAAMKILGGENPKMSASEYYTRLLVAGGFGALSYLAGVYENQQVRQYAEQGAEAYTAAQEAASAGNADAYSEALTVLNNSAANISTIVASGAIPAAEAVQAADIISGVVASMTTATANTPTALDSLPETGSAGAILPPPTGEASVPSESPVDSEFVIEAPDKIAGAITNKQSNALNTLNALGAEQPANGVVMPRAGEQLQTLRDRGIMNTKEGAQYGAEEIQRTGRDVYVPRGSERAPAESRVERSGGLGEAAGRSAGEGYLARADEAAPGGTEREAQTVLSGTQQQVTVAADAKDKDVGGVTIARTEDAAKVMPGLKAGTTVGVVSGNDTAAIKAAKARDAKSGIKTTYVAGGSFTTADGKQGRGACVKYHDGHVEMLVAVDDPQADANQINAHEHGHLAVMTGKLNVRDTVDAFRDTYTHGADAANMIIDTYLQLDGISPDDAGVYTEKDLEELLCNALGNINAFEGMSTFDPLSAGLRDLRKFILDRLDPDTRSWFDDNVKAAPTSTKIAPQTNVGKSEAAEPAKARPPTVKESAKQNIRMVDGAAVTPDVEKVMESPDYEPPVDYMKLSVNTRDAWKKSYLEQFNSKDAERVAKVVDMFTDKMIANDAVMGYVPVGSYKYDSKGPLRGNIEYIVTYDMDTSCPRTFQFINYRDALQAIAGRPLNYKESINLLELMRAYGQQIPCAYCYVENKRVLLSSSYNNFFTFRQNVMNADTDADALKQMYSYNAKKGKVSDAAKKVFDTWRADRSYNPSVQEVWDASQASRNAVLNFLDARRSAGTITDKTSTKAVMDMVKMAFNLSDNGAVTEVASYVADWMYDTDAKIPHIYTVPNTENATVDEKALALHHEALAYAKSASSAKSVENYAPYTDQLKNISQKDKDYINGMGGIRKHSSNDFRMDYVQDYIMFFADLAAGKWMGHTYTKSTDYVKVFGRTGDRINMSIAMYGGENGTAVRQNLDEGMAWKDARELRKAYKNAGVMAMVTNNAQLSYALNTEDFVDMIIPFHASGLDKAVWYNLRMWNDYTSKQLERFLNAKDMKAALKEKRIEIPKGAKAAEIRELYDKEFHIKKIYAEDGTLVKPHFLPGDTYVNGQLVPGHHNDVKLYKKLCAEYGVHPRFDGVMVTDKNGKTINVVDHPNYIRLVKETARTDSEQTPIQFNFDEEDPFLGMTPLDYAMERMEQEAKNGGYENTKDDPYGIVREFREQYLGKDRPLGYLTERAKEYQAIREEQQREAQEKLDKELQVDEIKLSKKSPPEYLTEEAKKRFASDPRFAKLAHRDLAYVVAASRDHVSIPAETLLADPTIAEAQAKIDAHSGKTSLDSVDPNDPKTVARWNGYIEKALDAEHGSFSGKDKDGNELFRGPVAREKKAFVVIGPPSAGKSTVFANPVSRDNRARIIDSDVVKPWIDGFDGGYGAGYVQEESSRIADMTLDAALERGENIVLPRVGSKSTDGLLDYLRDKGYNISLLYNEVSPETYITRAMARFADKNRYLDLNYLRTIGNKAHDAFQRLAEIADYAEWRNNDVDYGKKPKLVWKTGDGTDALRRGGAQEKVQHSGRNSDADAQRGTAFSRNNSDAGGRGQTLRSVEGQKGQPQGLTDAQQKNYDYNQNQSETGSQLKTLKGSPIRRSKYGVGKDIGGTLYLHRDYVDNVVPADVYETAQQVLAENYPDFTYNCVEWNPKDNTVRFDEAPGFDTEREPAVGDYVTVRADGSTKKGHTDYIWHHKWQWVKDDYKGFNVKEAWEWSKQWLSTISGKTYDVNGKEYNDRGVSDGNGIERWNAQLDAYGLPRDGVKPVKQSHTSRGTSINTKKLPALYSKATFQPGTVNIDIGAGVEGTPATAYLDSIGVKSLPFDPFNRNLETNKAVVDFLKSGEKADTATCSNCLNVIDNADARANVILQMAKAIKQDGTAYFTVYSNKENLDAGKAGEVKSKPDQWQEFREAKTYVPEIRQYFNDVPDPKGGLIVARDPKANLPQATWQLASTEYTDKEGNKPYTEDVAVRYSTTQNNEITRLQNENKRLKKQVEYWQGQTKATEGWKADAKQEAKVTREILKSTSSKLDADETTRRIMQLHEDLSNGKLTYEEGKAAATQIASDIINKSSAMVSKSTESYRAAQKIIKSTPQIDLAYSRLQQELGKDVFPDALSAQEKQDTIREVMDSLKPVIDNPYDLNKAIVIESVADDIINAGMEMRQADPTVVDIERAKTAEAKAEGARAVEEQRKLDQMYYNRKMAEIRKQRDEKVEKILQHQREVRQNARERKQEASDRQTLLRLAKRFQSKKIDPVTKAQLPDIVKDLDTVSVNLTDKSVRNITELRQWYNDKTTEGSDIYDPNFIPDEATKKKLERLEKIQIGSMSIEEVRELTDVLRNIEHNMTEARKFQRSQLRIDNYEAGMRFISDIDNAQKGGINRELNPLRAARRMAGYNDGAIEGTTESPVITLMKECIKGERQARMYTREATKMLSKYLNDKPFMRKLYGRHAQEIMITGYDARTGEKRTVAITPAMRISLYLHSLNDDNMRHIQNGGVLIPDMRQYKRGNMAEAYAGDTRLKLTKTNVASICANMTEQERGFARALWRYFNEYAPKSLNETSVELDGYEKFLEENYFPINVDRNFIGQDFQEMVMDDKGSLTHPGFGEERVQSSKPIYLRDANEIFSNAVRQNAAYACKAVPLSNLNKLVNVQQVGAGDSVQAALARQFTANAKNPVATSGSDYLAKFMRDYAGNKGGKKSGTDKLLAKIRSNYAGAVLTLAGGTAIKQAASYPTAAAVVSAKSLARALNPARTVDTSFIDERTATFTQRTEGYSSIEQAELSQEGKHIPKALNWIQAVDVATTRALKRAAAIEVQNTTDLKIGTEEYKQAVVDMYERIIEETQPNHSVAQRPDILRSDSALERALVMFATQPMQNFGILYDAVNDYGAKQRAYKNTGSAEARKAMQNAGKTLGKAIGSQLASALVFALMQAAYDWYRKKDDKYKDEGEWTLGSFAKGLGLTMASTGAGMFIGGKVLLEFAEVFADEIASKTGGKKYFGANAYGFDVAELEAITDATKSAVNAVGAISGAIGSAAGGEDVNYEVLARKIWAAAEDAAKLAGIPAENATTMITSAAKQVMEATMGEYIGDYYALRIGASPDSSKAAFYDNLYACWTHASNAKLRELYDIMLEDGFTPDGVKSAMESRAKKAQGVKSVKELKNRWPYK